MAAIALTCDDPRMSHNTRQRRFAALRACDRILSGVQPTTMRDRLADMDAGGDLDDEPDFYGDGPVTMLEERVANLLGTEAAVFFPTGTMAQQVALRYGADRSGHPTVALHPLGHLEMDERHTYAHLSDLRSTWPTTEPRNPTAEEITALAEPVGTVVLELPLRNAGFVLPSWDELAAASAAARAIGARVHFDGARMWESTAHLAHTLSEIADLADSTYVSFYKTIGGISGAALAGTTELASYARIWRHRYWRPGVPAVAGRPERARWPEQELPRVPEYARHARTVAAALATLPGAWCIQNIRTPIDSGSGYPTRRRR